MCFNDRETELLDFHIPFHTASIRHEHKSTLNGITTPYQNRSVFGLDRPSADSCPPNTHVT
jgi:hypothetical protein